MRLLQAMTIFAAASASPQGPAASRAPRAVSVAQYDVAASRLEPNVAAHIFDDRLNYRWLQGGRMLWLETNSRAGPRSFQVNTTTGRRTEGRAPADLAPAPAPPPSDALASPDGKTEVFARGNNLWLRSLEERSERPLTTDGEPFFAYGKLFDDSTRTLPRGPRPPSPPANVAWSPDGRLLVGLRNDERAVLPYPYLESAPRDGSVRPKVHEVRVTLLGEPGRIVQKPFIIDVASGRRTPIVVAPEWVLDPTPVGWGAGASRLFLLATAADKHAGALLEVDTATGSVRTVVSERSETSSYASFFNAFEYNFPNVRVLGGGREAVWFSQRRGRAGLYLYDVASGRLERELTPGPGVVIDVIAVDEPRRRLFATLAGVDAARDPYQRDLYAVALDGGAPVRLTPAGADHQLAAPLAPFWSAILGARPGPSPVSPDGRTFIDIASTVDTSPVATLRSTTDGRAIAELARADAADALASGWRPPARFRVKAADGRTELWGAVFLPPDYDPAKRYPVIDALYGGPQIVVAPRNFSETASGASILGRASLASLGFVVVTVDGRGTPGRDLAFWEAGYGDFADVAVDDHVAALEQLARQYPGMDLSRIGVYGHSFGGYVATRAMLRRPDVYKVGIASAAVQNWQGFRDAYEQYQGRVDYGGGARLKPTPTAVPEHYRALDNAALADRLRGKLLIAYTDLDENALPSSTLQFIDALTRANKSYDLIYLANRDHGFGADAYFIRRSFDYFVEHLAGRKPPPDYTLTLAPRVR